MSQEELFAKIDPFLWKHLSEEEHKRLQQEMRDNLEFLAEVTKRKLEHEVIKQMRRDALAEKMKIWDAEKKSEKAADSEGDKPDESGISITKTPTIVPIPAKRLMPLRRVMQWAMAASIALLAIVTISYYSAKRDYDGTAVAAVEKVKADTTFFPKITNENVGTSGIDEELRDSVNTYFKDKQYGKAAAYLDNLRKNTEGGLVDSTQQRMEWYLVLSYTGDKKTNNSAQFNTILTRILQNPQHRFYENAQLLKSKMDSFWWRWFN